MNKVKVNVVTPKTMNAEPMRGPFYLALNGDCQVVYAGFGAAPPGMLADDVTYMTGDTADLLYRAITGHSFDQPARLASIGVALDARSDIFYDQRISAVTALRALAQYDSCIQPGIGHAQLDRRGRLTKRLPESIPLPELSL